MGALWGVFNLVAPSNFLLLFVHPSPSLFFRLYLSEMHLFVVPFYRRRRLLVTFSQFLRLPLLRLFILYVLQLPLLFAPGTVHSVTFTQAQRGQESGTGIPGCTERKVHVKYIRSSGTSIYSRRRGFYHNILKYDNKIR